MSGRQRGGAGAPLPREAVEPGLCADCAEARRVVSARGSVFWRCARAESDPAFTRYPRLPVLRCAGHRPGGAGPLTETEARG